MDRTTVHRIWKAVLLGIALVVAAACYLFPVLLIALGALLLALVGARWAYPHRDRYIPNLYARDVRIYDAGYRAFIARSLAELRRCKIAGHPLLWEAARLPQPADSDELLLDLGVWIGWSTRLTCDASGRAVYGFDTFEGLVEDWQIEDHVVINSGVFALSDPFTRRFLRDTGVHLCDGVPAALGRDVRFVKGRTYDTLAPFLAGRPGVPIRLFHMDLDTYDSCLHALETCKDHFVAGSTLVFDEYLVTNGEMRAFYEFQDKYELQWRYRSWGLEMWEMNLAMVTSPWRRGLYYLGAIALYALDGRYTWKFFRRRFWRFWLGAPTGDIAFMLGAVGQRKSVSLEITGLGKLDPARRD